MSGSSSIGVIGSPKRDEEVDPLETSPFSDRRLGMFSTPIDWIEGMQTRHFRQIFQHFRIVRAELDYVSNSMQYVAASDFFDPVPRGAQPGSYNIVVDPGPTPEAPIGIRVQRIG